jgi:hypothetical protein
VYEGVDVGGDVAVTVTATIWVRGGPEVVWGVGVTVQPG